LAFQPCPGICKIAFNFSLPDGQLGVNTFYASTGLTDPISVVDIGVIASASQDWFETGDGGGHTYRARVSDQVILDNITVTDLTEEGGAQVSLGVADAGEDTAQILSNGLSIAMSERSALSGRSFRGRKYWVGMTTDSVNLPDANSVNSDFITDSIAAFNAYITAITGAATSVPMQLVVLSRINKDAVPAPPHIRTEGIGTAVIAYTLVDSELDFQRRRAPNHNR